MARLNVILITYQERIHFSISKECSFKRAMSNVNSNYESPFLTENMLQSCEVPCLLRYIVKSILNIRAGKRLKRDSVNVCECFC